MLKGIRNKRIEANQLIKDIAKSKVFNSRLDLLIFLAALCVSAFIFLEKILFLTKVYGNKVSLFDILQLLVINLAAYLVICTWVFILLSNNKSWLVRLYVLIAGVYFCSVTRIIEIGESSTRQGVDFFLVNHLVLTTLGYQEWKVFLFEWFIKLHVFVILFLALGIKKVLFKTNNTRSIQFSKKLFFLALIISFINPPIANVPKSIRQNSLVYLVISAWFPVKGLQINTDKNVVSGRAELIENKNVQHQQAFSGLAKGKNVVIFALESTGANMLDFYENNDAVKGSTPFLSEFVQSSIKFNQTSAVMTSTTKSLVSILCGIEPYLDIASFEMTLGIPVECLPTRLSRLGYESIYFQTATKAYEHRDRLAERMGFQQFISLDELPDEDKKGARIIGPFGLEDNVLLNENQRWLNQQKKKDAPFFAFYLTLAQHHPYLKGKKANVTGNNLSENYKNNFVNSLSYIDTFLKNIVEQYKQAGLYEDTLFIVVGDHGEAFGFQHPPRFHNNILYREGLWVPFLVINEKLFPELIENNALLSLIDVAPTIEDLLGIELFEEYRGFSAFALPENRKTYAACWYKNRCLSVMDEHYKYIYNFNDSPDELYAIKNDIHEQHNLLKKFPELAASYQQQLFLWYSDVMFYYGAYYEAIDKHYIKSASSYYQFPKDFYTFKKQAIKNEKNNSR